MIWSIGSKPDNATILNPAIVLEPADEIVHAFFTGTYAHTFPALLRHAVQEQLFGTGMVGVKFYQDLDEEDFFNKDIFEEDEVQVSHQLFGKSILDKAVFYQIVLEYAQRLLTMYRDNDNLQKEYDRWLLTHTASNYYDRQNYLEYNSNWALAMEMGIQDLKQELYGKE